MSAAEATHEGTSPMRRGPYFGGLGNVSIFRNNQGALATQLQHHRAQVLGCGLRGQHAQEW